MTNQDIIIAILLLVVIIAQTWLLAQSTASSHSGATSPSTLPPPPESKHSGPWYLHIVFLDPIETPDLYIKADDMLSIVARPKTNLLLVSFTGGEHSFKDVSRYDFVQLSQMGKWLLTKKDIYKIMANK